MARPTDPGAKVVQVQGQMSNLAHELDQLDEVIGTMHDRLSLVLTQPRAEKDGPVPERESLVPLANQIREQTERVINTRVRISDLLTRMEI